MENYRYIEETMENNKRNYNFFYGNPNDSSKSENENWINGNIVMKQLLQNFTQWTRNLLRKDNIITIINIRIDNKMKLLLNFMDILSIIILYLYAQIHNI